MKSIKVSMKYFLFFIFLLTSINRSFTQETNKSEAVSSTFYFDAFAFRSDSTEKSRLDAFIVVPFQSLSFIKAENDEYYSKYELLLTCYDFTGNPISEKKLDKVANAKSFQISQGLNADFDKSIISIFLNDGTYRVKVEVTDLLSKVIYERTREVSVINYRKFAFSLSGVMLVSSIFETEGKMSITPFLNDNISNFEDGFFAFFETYNQKEADTVDFIYQILKDKKVIEQSNRFTKVIPSGSSQEYLKIKKFQNLQSDTYILKIIALNRLDTTEVDEKHFLAVTQRTISYIPSLAGNIIENIDQAIKQLRYVATNSQITYINEATNYDEKVKRFKQFWEMIDPSPNTAHNEAFDEYYSRIEYANEKFKSYAQGWQTDMGMVYIIYGPPNQVERRQDYYNPNRYYERWTYINNREFIFVDNNGFGDFRLTNSSQVTDKYEYNPNK